MSVNLDDSRKRPEEKRQETQQIKAKGRYWWGLLGLIPLLGAIVGVVMLVLSIFLYKDKSYSI